MNQSQEMVKIAFDALDDKKAEDIRVIKIDQITTIADYMVVTNGTNSSHVKALQDAVDEKLSKSGFTPKRIEGLRSSNWILMDYGDVIIHIFSKEDRLFYDLEKIWRDGQEINIKDI